MSKAKGVRKADDLMRKLVGVPKSEVGQQKPKRKKRRKKK